MKSDPWFEVQTYILPLDHEFLYKDFEISCYDMLYGEEIRRESFRSFEDSYNSDQPLRDNKSELCHIYPDKLTQKKPQLNFHTPPLPMFMSAWIRKGTVFPEYLDALKSWFDGNKSWNPGAVHSHGGQFQSCYVLNFVLPSPPSTIVDPRLGHFDYVSTSTLIYTKSLGPLQEPLHVAISDSSKTRSIFGDVVRRSAANSGIRSYPTYMVFHANLAHISTNGWGLILLQLEYEVRTLTQTRRGSLPADHYEIILVMIDNKLDEVSRGLGVNVEAMALLKRLPGYTEYEDATKKDRFEVGIEISIKEEASAKAYSTTPSIIEVERSTLVMYDRASKLKKELARAKKELTRVKAEETSREISTLLEHQMKIAFLSRGMNRILGLTVMVFLPGIFLSTLFSSNFFEFSDVGDIKVAGSFWIFWAVMIPVSTVIFGALVVSTTSLRFRPLQLEIIGLAASVIQLIGFTSGSKQRRTRKKGPGTNQPTLDTDA